MKIVSLAVVLFLFAGALPLLALEDESTDRNEELTQILSLYGGKAYWGKNVISDLGMGGMSFDIYFASSYLTVGVDIELWVASNGWYTTSLLTTSSSLYLHPLQRGMLDVYGGIGVLRARDGGNDYETFDMPVTVGVNLWLTPGFGFKAQVRKFLFSDQNFYNVSGGIVFTL